MAAIHSEKSSICMNIIKMLDFTLHNHHLGVVSLGSSEMQKLSRNQTREAAGNVFGARTPPKLIRKDAVPVRTLGRCFIHGQFKSLLEKIVE